jgi:hypothetical protein
MAYSFLQSVSRSFQALGAISSIATPWTLFVRQQYPNTAANRGVVGVSTNGSNDNYYRLLNTTGSLLQARSREVTPVGDANATLPGTNTWFAALGVFASSTSRTAYVDTTSGTNTTNVPSYTVDSLTIGVAAAQANTFSGDLADFAVWDVALTADDVASLTAGFKPFRVRPQHLLYYVPMVRDVNEIRNSIAFTASANAPVVADHPRVY